MFDEDDSKKNDRGGDKKPPGGLSFPPFTWIAWIAIIGAIAVVMYFYNHRMNQPPNIITQSQFLQKFESNQVVRASVVFNQQTAPLTEISGICYQVDKDGNVVKENGKPKEIAFAVPNAFLTEKMVEELMRSDKIKNDTNNQMLSAIGYQLLFFLGIGVLFWFFFIRQIKIAGKGALSFGKSKARLLAKDRNKITFKDVAGVDEAIEEV